MSCTRVPVSLSVCTAVLLTMVGVVPRAAGETPWSDALKAAKPGTVVAIPEGRFKVGDLILPPGVGVQGSGYGKTILDATGFRAGLVLKGESAGRVSDLTVFGAAETGILLDGAVGAEVERVVVRNCANGILARNARNGTIRNVVSAGNRNGAILSGCSGTALVNCTLADNATQSLSLSGNRNVTVFNNLMTGSDLGVYVDARNEGLALDHNVYVAQIVGSLQGHTPRKRVEAWRDLSGLDRHSVTIPVQYENPGQGLYRPVSPMSWLPDRATTADWGVPELNGVRAPENDMDAKARHGGVDAGACEVELKAPRPPDGTFKVKSRDGVVSAGLYTKEGRLVNYLFQNLPLARGEHGYWLPSRDWQGRAIPARDYEVRLVEANLRLDYVCAAWNGDMETSRMPGQENRCSQGPEAIGFDRKDRIILAQNSFENGQHVRVYDPDFRKVNWVLLEGGGSAGLAVDAKGRVLVMRKPGSLIRLDAETGAAAVIENNSMEKSYPNVFQDINGMTVLKDKLYVADPKSGKIVALTGENLAVGAALNVPSPAQPAADEAHGLLWVISQGRELLALNEKGEILHRATPVEKPALLSVRNGLMAVYSAAANRIEVFDCANPADLKPVRTLGRGGEGYGPIEPDRLKSPGWLSLNGKGEVAVSDAPRVLLFAADGTPRRHYMSMWGQGISWGRFAGDEKAVRFLNIGGGWDIVLDPKSATWKPGNFYKYTMPGLSPMFVFNHSGRNFGAFRSDKPPGVLLMEFGAGGIVKPRVAYTYVDGKLCVQRDANGDGVIDAKDPAEPLAEKDGKPITTGGLVNDGRALMSGVDFRADGALAIPRLEGVLVVPFKGINATGLPEYDFAARTWIPVTAEGKPEYLSPYDFTTKERMSIAEDMSYFDDGFTAAMTTKTGAGPDLCTEHANATSLAGFDKDGGLRWFNAMNPRGLKVGFYGITTIGGVTFAGRGAICTYDTVDRDGLGLGVLGVPKEMSWLGMWLDNHRQTQGFDGPGGRAFLIVGDYCAQAYHWMELKGHKDIRRQTLNAKVSEDLAATLKSLPPPFIPDWPVPAQTKIVVRKLSAPLPADGDIRKWRNLGIAPQIVITPELSSGVKDARDSSAVIRLAWSPGRLHVLAIKFDDVITMHQTEVGRHYQQDGLEMAVNSYPSGFKFNVTRFANLGDTVYRDTWRGSWGQKDLNRLLTPQEAPRVIKILGNAATVEDRKLIEAARGEDLSNAKVMIIEFSIPASALTPMENKDLEVVFESGRSFHLGFLLNDNDVPGSNMFHPIPWPATYGTFERVEKGAIASLE